MTVRVPCRRCGAGRLEPCRVDPGVDLAIVSGGSHTERVIDELRVERIRIAAADHRRDGDRLAGGITERLRMRASKGWTR